MVIADGEDLPLRAEQHCSLRDSRSPRRTQVSIYKAWFHGRHHLDSRLSPQDRKQTSGSCKRMSNDLRRYGLDALLGPDPINLDVPKYPRSLIPLPSIKEYSLNRIQDPSTM